MVINMTRIAGTVESSADLTAAFLVLHPRPTPTRGIARRRPDDHPLLRNRLGIGRSGRLVRWGETGAVGELPRTDKRSWEPPGWTARRCRTAPATAAQRPESTPHAARRRHPANGGGPG